MLDGMKRAAQGMISMMQNQEIISSNLANVGTAGFRKDKAQVTSFSEVLEKEMAEAKMVKPEFWQAGGGLDTVGMLFTSSATSFAQGALKQTGNNFDLALDDNGKGFFTIQTPEGIRYTRNGSFKLSTTGNLVTSDGSFVMGHKGPIKVSGTNFEVTNEGAVLVNGEQIDQLLITTFDDPGKLRKIGANYFVSPTSGKVSADSRVKQGFLEMSNVNAIKEMVDMITVMRAYEANQKVLQTEDQMLGRATGEVGRIR